MRSASISTLITEASIVAPVILRTLPFALYKIGATSILPDEVTCDRSIVAPTYEISSSISDGTVTVVTEISGVDVFIATPSGRVPIV